MSLAIAPLVTITMRRFGTQIPMLIGVTIQTVGFISASFSHKIWQLYISQGVLIGTGLGFISIPCSPIVAQWFAKKRSLAVGISSAGSGIGGLIFSFAVQAMIDNISTAWAFRITAAIAGVMNLLAVALIRNRNAIVRPPQLGFDTKLLARYDVLLMLSWGFISMLGYMTLLYSIPNFATSIGLSTSQAAATSAYLNLGIAVGRPLTGYLSDRYGRVDVAGLCTLFCGVSCFAIWIPAKSYGVTSLFAVVSGAVVGVFWMVSNHGIYRLWWELADILVCQTVAPISAEVAGLPQVPSMLSLTWLTIVAPTLSKHTTGTL
jgi:MFS family permease